MKRIPLWLLALILVAWAGEPVVKGRLFFTDADFSQSFEEEDWDLGWTVVDGDSSGSSWTRFSLLDYFDPYAGDWSLGVRYNADGRPNDDWLITPALQADSSDFVFRFRFRSQDVDYLEHLQIYTWRGSNPPDFSSMGSSELESVFTLEEGFSSVPTSWLEYERELPLNPDEVWHFALRCVSVDRYVLLVDGFDGLKTIAGPGYFRQSVFAETDFGVVHVDSIGQRDLRVWNLSDTDTLQVWARFAGSPDAWLDPPFALFESDPETLQVLPEQSLELESWIIPVWAAGDEDSVFVGDWHSTLLVEYSTNPDSAWSRDSLQLSALVWQPDAPLDAAWSEDFHVDSTGTLEGWTLGGAWAPGEFISSLNFTVPWREEGQGFVYINSDGEGAEAIQQDTLLSSQIALDAGQDWSLVMNLFLQKRIGDDFQVLARGSDGAWELLARPEAADAWELHRVGLPPGIASTELAFVYSANWSFGVALDDLALIAGDSGAPEEIPPAPRLPETIELKVAPNPFNPSTLVRFDSPRAGMARLGVYNLLGQQVYDSGPQRIQRGPNLSPIQLDAHSAGVYILVLEGPGFATERKITLLK